MPCRLAAFGDSHTAGDGWPGPFAPLDRKREPDWKNPWLNPLCRLNSVPPNACRGNYPRLLQGLLGSQFIVRNFGKAGRATEELLPTACHPSVYTSVGIGNNTALEHALHTIMHKPNSFHNKPLCEKELLQTPVFTALAEFKPHIVALLLGTNDALHERIESNRTTTGLAGFAHGIVTIIYGLWQLSGNDGQTTPSILLLEPPLTMSDYPMACTRMHTCRYHPFLPCWTIGECITCSSMDRLDSDPKPKDPTQYYQKHAEGLCVRLDALKFIRHASRLLASHIHLKAADGTTSSKHASLRCDGSSQHVLHYVRTNALVPDWRWFSGPYHLSPIGSAFLACTVYEALATVPCGRAPCAGGGVAWAESLNVSDALAPPPFDATRAKQFCEPILSAARGERVLTSAYLGAMEAVLFSRSTGG